MEKINLPNITLVAIDCINTQRAIKALDISSEKINFGSVKLLTSLPCEDTRTINIPHTESIQKYSEFCLKDLNKYIDTEFALLVQFDGFILNPESWDNGFLKYDYIGAPWFLEKDFWFKDFELSEDLRNTWLVGNGGFSLRSKKLLQTCELLFNNGTLKKIHPEDFAICAYQKNEFEKHGIKIAPKEIAEKFSIEGQALKYDKQFGFHGLKWTNISKWIKTNKKWNIRQNKIQLLLYKIFG